MGPWTSRFGRSGRRSSMRFARSRPSRSASTRGPRMLRFRGPGAAGTVRLVDAAEAARLRPALYERVRGEVPGMLARSAMWWNRRVLYDPPHRRGDALALAFAVYEDAGGVQGALTYRR